ncbi:hypothetical protein TWF696_003010 [Orbilia brochopaga]|uniref:Uncharacterized protein n=1 Tax=Orbilia brochopaga TaxID=3140254 RepID=A0AAV9U385_9PEZI
MRPTKPTPKYRNRLSNDFNTNTDLNGFSVRPGTASTNRSNDSANATGCKTLSDVSSSSWAFQNTTRRPPELPLQTELKVCGAEKSEPEPHKNENTAPANTNLEMDIEELIRQITGQ